MTVGKTEPSPQEMLSPEAQRALEEKALPSRPKARPRLPTTESHVGGAE